jgi:hypothetical protein
MRFLRQITGAYTGRASVGGAGSLGIEGGRKPRRGATGQARPWACAAAVTAIAAALPSGAAPPNLVLYSVSAEGTALAGAPIGVRVWVKNRGRSGAGASYVRAWLSKDRVLSPSSDIATDRLGRTRPLAADASVFVRWHPRVRASTPVGSYYLIVCADATRRVRESAEADNCRAGSTYVTGLELTIDTPEEGETTGRRVRVYYWTQPSPSSMTCSLDGAAAVACPSTPRSGDYASRLYTELAGGTHTVVLHADYRGATASATRSWTVDATPPTVYFYENSEMPAEGSIWTGTRASMSWTTDDADVTLQQYWCSLDGVADGWGCQPPYGLVDLAKGPHAFSVKAKDDHGNVSAPITRHWTVAY